MFRYVVRSFQELVQQCQNWLKVMKKEDVEPAGICKVPLVCTKKDCDRIVTGTTKVNPFLMLQKIKKNVE